MMIYQDSVAGFMKDMELDLVMPRLREVAELLMTHNMNQYEIDEWRYALLVLYRLFNDDRIPRDAQIAFGFSVPHTSKRVEVMLSGTDEQGQEQVILLGLKLWEKVEMVDSENNTIHYIENTQFHAQPHPSYQLWSYKEFIRKYNGYVSDRNVQLHSYVYLPDCSEEERDKLHAEVYKGVLPLAPVFTCTETPKLRQFILQYLSHGEVGDTLKNMESSGLLPLALVPDVFTGMVEGSNGYLLLDWEKECFGDLNYYARKTDYEVLNPQYAVVVRGAPHTGKTTLALSLLVKRAKKDRKYSM